MPGLYAGGSILHFFGPSVRAINGNESEPQTLIGGDIGYKLFPRPEIELRPFLFAGVGIFDRLNEETRTVDTGVDFTLDPAFLAAYHFGNAFVSAEARLQVTPTPARIAILGGLGLGL
jgi:hypothetical protein